MPVYSYHCHSCGWTGDRHAPLSSADEDKTACDQMVVAKGRLRAKVLEVDGAIVKIAIGTSIGAEVRRASITAFRGDPAALVPGFEIEVILDIGGDVVRFEPLHLAPCGTRLDREMPLISRTSSRWRP